MRFYTKESLKDDNVNQNLDSTKTDKNAAIELYCKFTACNVDDLNKNKINDWALNRTCTFLNKDKDIVMDYLFNKEYK